MLLAITVIAGYLLFGFFVIYLKNNVGKSEKFNLALIAPILISFVLGIGLFLYSIMTIS